MISVCHDSRSMIHIIQKFYRTCIIDKIATEGFFFQMDTYKIAIDTFLAETSECKASGCAVFSGADIAFQDIQLHTHRNKSELHFMAGHTMLSIPLASILSIEKLVLRDIQSIEYEIITKEGGTITLDVV